MPPAAVRRRQLEPSIQPGQDDRWAALGGAPLGAGPRGAPLLQTGWPPPDAVDSWDFQSIARLMKSL